MKASAGTSCLKLRALVWGVLGCALSPWAWSQQGDSYPSRAVTIVVTSAPGSSTDFQSRLAAKKLSDSLGQPFVVDNKPGAGTSLATALVAKAIPNGYTLLGTSVSFTMVPQVYKNLTYDSAKDLVPISMLSKEAQIFVVHPSFPAKNVAEYIAYVKSHPGEVDFGATGAGTSQHIFGAWLESLTGTKVTYVQYKDIASWQSDLISGRVKVTISPFSVAVPLVKAGKLRALGMTSAQRSEIVPDLPTVAEQGVPGFDANFWVGLFAPRQTPTPVITRLGAEMGAIAKDPEVRKVLLARGAIPMGSTPEQFGKLVLGELDRWEKLVQKAGIKLQE
jgi:tripartite-type tricarboxylate transporter receptor subunit TctC